MSRGWDKSTVKKQKDIEWDSLFQAICLYLQEKLMEKPVPEKACVTQALTLLL